MAGSACRAMKRPDNDLACRRRGSQMDSAGLTVPGRAATRPGSGTPAGAFLQNEGGPIPLRGHRPSDDYRDGPLRPWPQADRLDQTQLKAVSSQERTRGQAYMLGAQAHRLPAVSDAQPYRGPVGASAGPDPAAITESRRQRRPGRRRQIPGSQLRQRRRHRRQPGNVRGRRRSATSRKLTAYWKQHYGSPGHRRPSCWAYAAGPGGHSSAGRPRLRRYPVLFTLASSIGGRPASRRAIFRDWPESGNRYRPAVDGANRPRTRHGNPSATRHRTSLRPVTTGF